MSNIEEAQSPPSVDSDAPQTQIQPDSTPTEVISPESQENEPPKSEMEPEKEEEIPPFQSEPKKFRDKCLVIENILKNDSNMVDGLKKAVELTKEATKIVLDLKKDRDDPSISEEMHENAAYLLRSGVPKWVPLVLQRPDIPRATKPSVAEFLTLFIDVGITLGIAEEIPEQIHCLSRVFLHTSPFFYNPKTSVAEKKKEDEKEEETNKEKEALKALFRFSQKPEGTTISSIYFQLIDHFGKKAGFQVLLQKLDGNNSLTSIRNLLKIVSSMKAYLAPSFLTDFAPKCHQIVFSCLLTLAAVEFNKDDKIIVAEIGDVIQGLLLLVWPENKLEEAIDRFNLDVAFKNFTSTNLERKLRGIKFIRKMVSRAEASNKDDRTFFNLWKAAATATANAMIGTNPNEKKKEAELKPLDPKFLMDWLKENEVVGCICKTTHPEVIKQSLSILIFAAKLNQMDLSYFISLYEYVLGKHESVKNTILTSIIQIVPHLSPETTQLFFEHVVKSTPYEEFDNETIQFFHNYTLIALSKSTVAPDKQTNWYGLPLLSAYIAEAEKLPNNSLIMSKVAFSLVDLLQKPECQNQRPVYMDACVENIKHLRAVPDSLVILARIIATHFKTSKRKKPTVNSVIETLEQKHQMLQSIFKELIHYRKSLDSSSKEDSSSHNQNNPKVGKFTHLEHVSIRLEFLQFILSNSSLTLNAEQTDVLWDSLITKSLNPAEREKMFLWLQNSTKYLSGSIGSNPFLNNSNSSNSSNSFTVFDDPAVVSGTNSALGESIIEHLFVEKMISMDFSSLSRAGFQLFDNYFLIVNLRAQRLKKISGRGVESSSAPNVPSPNVSQPSVGSSSLVLSSNLNRAYSTSNLNSSSNGLVTNPSSQDAFFTINSDKDRLLGITELCSIASESEDSLIAFAAIWRLNSFHLYHSGDSLKARACKWREDHIQTWINFLETSFQSLEELEKSEENSKLSKEKAEEKVERCLHLLKTLVEDFDERTKKKVVNSHSSRELFKQIEGKQMTFFVRSDKGSSPVIQMLSTDTVLQLRYKIAELIHSNPRAIRICTSDRELKEEGKTLSESRLQDRQTLIVRRRNAENYSNAAQSVLKRPGSFFSLSSAFGNPKPAEKKEKSSNNQDETSYDEAPAEALVGEGLRSVLAGLLGVNVNLPIKRRQNLASTFSVDSKIKDAETFQQGMQKMLAEPPKGYPSQILSTQKYFKTIYRVLNYPGKKIGRKAWELLSQLQINEGLFQQMKTLHKGSEKPNWNELLDTQHSTFKLVYSLQIVQILVHNPNIADAKKDETEPVQKPWRKRFIETGGLHHLLCILSEPILQEPIGRNKFYALLLSVINSLTLQPSQKRESTSRRPSHSFRDRSVLSAIEPQALVLKLLEISFDAASSNGEDVEDAKGAVQNALDMLIACVFSAQDVLWYFYGYKQLKDWLLCTILTPSEKDIREGSSRLVRTLCTKGLVASNSQLQNSSSENGKENKKELGLRSTASEEMTASTSRKNSVSHEHHKRTGSNSTEPRSPVIFFLDLLLSYLPQVERYHANCEQYFELLVTLFRNYMDSVPIEEAETRRQDPKWKDLLQRLLEQISAHPVIEKTSTGPPDRVIIGLLNFCRIFVRKFPSLKVDSSEICLRIIHETFLNCLFATPNAQSDARAPPPRCKTLAARDAAFSLLTEIVSDSAENCAGLCQLLFKQIEQLGLSKSWGYAPMDNEKSEYGYVGIQNLGATCYMNSLVQQLNFIPDFKRGLLSVDAKKEEETTQKDLQQNMLYQTQLLFSHLQESSKKFYNPSEFCNTLKDYEGKPINISVQMDCNEFSNMLFDKLEHQLKGTKQEHLLRDVFSGTFCNQLICKECPHSSERDEPFYTLSLEILRQKDILESLKLFIKGEMLVDDNKYFCDKCNRGVETLKRCVIKDLPNILLIHMKRFEFDYEKMKHIKLNDRCEFPYLNDLDMEPFTKEGVAASERQDGGGFSFNDDASAFSETQNRPPDYYKYELVGVVVHTGTADFGHYYSFIKERSTRKSGKPPSWFEFNDTTVSPFNPNEIPNCCFGGSEETTELDRTTGKMQPVSRVKNYNAYILVYQRKSTISRTNNEMRTHNNEESPKAEIPSSKEEVSNGKEEHLNGKEEYLNGKEEVSNGKEEHVNGKEEEKEDKLRSDSDDLLRIDGNVGEDHPLSLSSKENNLASPKTSKEDAFLQKLSNALRERESQNEIVPLTSRKQSPVPERILSSIWEENTQFLLERSVLSQDFFSFVWNFVNLFTTKTDQDLRQKLDSSFSNTVKFATIFLFEVYGHSRDKPMFDVWVNHLKRIYGTSPQAARWLLGYLSENRCQIKYLFLHCQFENLRLSFCGIIGSAIVCLAETPEEKSEGAPKSETSELAIFLQILLSNKMLTSVRKHSRWSAQYFLLIKYYCQVGPYWRKHLLDNNVIAKLVDYSMGNGDWTPKSTTGLTLPLRMAPQNMPHIVQIFALLARSCKGPFLDHQDPDQKPKGTNSPLLLPEPTFTMSQIDIRALLDRIFVGRLIREDVDIPATIDLMQHVCWEDQKASKLFTGLFKENLMVGFTSDMCKPWFAILSSLLQVDDSVKNWRLDMGLMNCLLILETHVRKKDLTDAFVKQLMKLANKNDTAKVWLFKHKDSLNHILSTAGYKVQM